MSPAAAVCRYTTDLAAEIPNTQRAVPAPVAIDTVVAGQPAAQEDETTILTDGFNMANPLINTTAGGVGEVIAA